MEKTKEQLNKKTEEQKIEDKTSDETNELREKLEKAEKLAEERLNQLKYLQADIDNLRKRYEKEKQEIIKNANESLIKELLVVLDSFDTAIKSKEENKKGLLMLEKKFFDILVEHGLQEIEAIGKQFNPNFHESLCKEFSKKQNNEIIEVIQKGYILDSKVIRTSKVKVSKGLKKEDKTEDNKEN
ncbi:MAG: nucleotide exchange factor GrpE [Candidatus Nanoarchaeia archaeon]